MADVIKQFTKNIFSSWAALAIRSVLVFLINPFIIHALGDDRYGMWVLVMSIINYMTILDLGFKQALIRFISRSLGLGENEKINTILHSGFLVYSGVAVMVLIISFLLSWLVLDRFNIPPELLSEGRTVLIIIAFHTALNFALLGWGNSLGAFHRYDLANALAIFENIARTIGIYLVLSRGGSLVGFALLFPLFSLVRLLAGMVLLKRYFPFIRFGLGQVSRETLVRLYRYGKIGFLISVIWLLVANTDHVLIGYFLDTARVTPYAIAGTLIIFLRGFTQAVTFPMRPMISHFEALGRIDDIRRVYRQGTSFLYFCSGLAAGATVILADYFIFLWMGPGYAEAAGILKILVVPAAFFLPQAVAFSILYAIEKHRYILWALLAEGLINFILSIILVRYYGLYGIAYGTVIPQTIVYLVVFPIIMRNQIGIALGRFYISSLPILAVSMLLGGGVSWVAVGLVRPDNWTVFGLEVMVVTALALAAARPVLGRAPLEFLKSPERR